MVQSSSAVVVPVFVFAGAGLAGTADGRVVAGLWFAVDALDIIDAANAVLPEAAAETGEAAAANFGSARVEVSLT